MTKLRLAPELSVPIDIVTETLAVLGIRGSGKTNTAVVLAEELLEHTQQVVVIDPTDVWWGLKSSADGQGPGYPVIVLGGRKAELPLGAGDGAAIADVVVDHGASLILALRHFESKADQRRFITDFASRLYYRKGQLDAPTPLMLIIDEASLVVPQNVMGESARMVGAIQQLVRQGRSSGIGVTLIDQRPASVNKDVLTQLEALVCHRTTSPQDRKALKEWVQQHDEHDRGPKFLESLASLEQGTAWVWSPGLLDIFKKVRIRPRRTFDSSRTPKAGERVTSPTAFASVDLDALRGQLAQTIEIARENDPKELQKKIRALERQLSIPAETQVDTDLLEIEVQQAIAEEGARHERYRKVLQGELAILQREIEDTSTRLKTVADRLDSVLEVNEDGAGVRRVEVPKRPPVIVPPRRPDPAPAAARSVSPKQNGDGAISGPARRILDALAFFEFSNNPAPLKKAVAAFVGVSSTTGTWTNRLSELRTAGLIGDPSKDAIQLTAAGRKIADRSNAPSSRRELQDRWLGKVSGPSSKILRILIDTYPDAIEKNALAAMVGVSASTGTWTNRLSELRVPGLLVDVSKTEVKASDSLFPRGLR